METNGSPAILKGSRVECLWNMVNQKKKKWYSGTVSKLIYDEDNNKIRQIRINFDDGDITVVPYPDDCIKIVDLGKGLNNANVKMPNRKIILPEGMKQGAPTNSNNTNESSDDGMGSISSTGTIPFVNKTSSYNNQFYSNTQFSNDSSDDGMGSVSSSGMVPFVQKKEDHGNTSSFIKHKINDSSDNNSNFIKPATNKQSKLTHASKYKSLSTMKDESLMIQKD